LVEYPVKQNAKGHDNLMINHGSPSTDLTKSV